MCGDYVVSSNGVKGLVTSTHSDGSVTIKSLNGKPLAGGHPVCTFGRGAANKTFTTIGRLLPENQPTKK